MSQDDIGLQFFTAEQRGPSPASVFGKVDQDEIIARIDDVQDDDLDSTFFGDSIQEVEDAATRAFDIGIRTLTNEPQPAGAPAFDAPPPPQMPMPDQGGGSTEIISGAALKQDERARRAFILGGPHGAVQ